MYGIGQISSLGASGCCRERHSNCGTNTTICEDIKRVGPRLGAGGRIYRHGGASAGGVLEHQGNGEEPGAGKEEELGVELGEAGRLQGKNEGRGCMPGDEIGSVKIGGGEKVKEPKAEEKRKELAGG